MLLGDAEAVKEARAKASAPRRKTDIDTINLHPFWLAIFAFIVWPQHPPSPADRPAGRRDDGGGGSVDDNIVIRPRRLGRRVGGIGTADRGGGGWSGGGGDFGGGGSSGSW